MAKMRVKDMKRDEVEVAVADATGWLRDFTSRNRKALVAALGALAVLIAGAAGARWWARHQESAAQDGLRAAAKLAADIDEPPVPPAGTDPPKPPTWPEVVTAYQAVASEHPRTSAGRIARFELGVAQMRAGDAPAALATLASFVDDEPDHFATPHALAALASAQEDTGDLAAAEATLQKLQDGEWRTYSPGTALQRMAEFLDRNDRSTEAAKLWKRLAEDKRFADTRAQSAAKAKVEPASPVTPING